MLYVFLVNSGTMMTFDVELALETVENLRLTIFKEYHIDPSNQVLLVSGGECLLSRDRVCKYTSAGTDTSPIYLFSKANCDLPTIPECTFEDMGDIVEECIRLDSNFKSISRRVEMAHLLFNADQSIIHSCEKLLHDQHLQHQGWASVVCNLNDISQDFITKAKMVLQLYGSLLKNQIHYHELLDNFESDKNNLKRIPLLKSLNFSNDFSDCDEISLYDWIQCKDPRTPIDAFFCRDDLLSFTEENMRIVESNVNSIMQLCNNPDMKEIKGLDIRLSALDKHMADAKKLFQKQGILKKTFNQNQTRMSDLQDSCVLPDLCTTHVEYLESMLKNHRDLIDYRNRFHSAKRELSDNLHHRLQWVIHVEETLRNADKGLMKCGLRLKKTRESLEIIQNLHLSPEIYLNSVVEVLRRKRFSARFHRWALETSEHARRIVESETCQRKLFNSVMDKHYIKIFFPGMDDLPCNFADPPVMFDKFLPNISSEDLDFLIERLPGMLQHLKVPSTFEIPQFDTDRNLIQVSPQIQQKSLHFNQETITSIMGDDIDKLKIQLDESEQKLKEKETELEQYKLKVQKLESNIESNRDFFKKFSLVRTDMIKTVQDIKKYVENDFKVQQNSLRDYFDSSIKEVHELLNDILEESEKLVKTFNVDLEEKNNQISEHLNEIFKHKKSLSAKDNELQIANSKIVDNNNLILSQECELERLRSEAEEGKQKNLKKIEIIDKIREHIKQFKTDNLIIKTNMIDKFTFDSFKIREDFLNEYQTLIQTMLKNLSVNVDSHNKDKRLEEQEEEIERMKLDHKNEIDSLKHRFKLAINTTSIQRTESETSLEKVQLDIVDHAAVEKEMQRLTQLLHEKKIEYEQNLLKMKNEYDNRIKNIEQDRLNSSVMLEGQEQILQRMKLKTYENLLSSLMLHLTNDTEVSSDECQQKLNSLRQLVTSCSMNLETIIGSQSVIAIPATLETPIQQQSLEWFTSQLQQLSGGDHFANDDRVNLNSCEIGDNVFVHFHSTYQQFAVFQKNSYLHFVHADSIREFEFSSSSDDSGWFIAKVLEKEFCMTKKAENRYKLPLDTKFFRVRVKQLTKFIPNSMFECIEQAFNMSRSIAISVPSSLSSSSSSAANTAGRTGKVTGTNPDPISNSVNFENATKRTF